MNPGSGHLPADTEAFLAPEFCWRRNVGWVQVLHALICLVDRGGPPAEWVLPTTGQTVTLDPCGKSACQPVLRSVFSGRGFPWGFQVL